MYRQLNRCCAVRDTTCAKHQSHQRHLLQTHQRKVALCAIFQDWASTLVIDNWLVNVIQCCSPGCQAEAAKWRPQILRPGKLPSRRSQRDQSCTRTHDLIIIEQIFDTFHIARWISILFKTSGGTENLSGSNAKHASRSLALQCRNFLCPLKTCLRKSPSFTFLVETTDDVVDVVREEPSVVQNCGQHRSNSSRRHLLVVLMLVHLRENCQN